MSRYEAALAELLIELEAQAPDRVCTRSYMDFSLRKQAELEAGIFTVMSGGVPGYPYEVSDDGGGGTNTNSSDFRVVILGQGVLPEGATGAEIEAAEFAMVEQLEALANHPFEEDPLATLQLRSISQSQQLDAPLFWIHSEWSLSPWSN